MIQRKFYLGDSWLYYKIYCGKKISDTIITELIQPICNELLNNKIILKWFFIRYEDPNNHIRLRFYLSDTKNIGDTTILINQNLKEYFNNGLIWNIQVDVYNRELERYGYNTIYDTESFFFIDSKICVKALNSFRNDEQLFLFTLRYIDAILDIFNYSIEEKIGFAEDHVKSFKIEFNADKLLNKQLNIKYQKLRNAILLFFEPENNNFKELLSEYDILEMKKISQSIVTKLIKENIILDDLLSSYLHMTINRMFRDKQRLHELVCYSCLLKFYKLKLSTNE